jgi:hypothetical protein
MISVVVCSINKQLAANVSQNILETIGVAHELIIIDNTIENKSINAVYNDGAHQAKFEIILFVHEDVLFTTNDWGKKIIHHFQENTQLGLIGIAGAKYKSKTNSGWFTGNSSFDCCNVLHIDKQGNQKRIFTTPNPGAVTERVVVIDGVFMCCLKSVWKEIKFNQTWLKGFHFYDLDFSLRVSKKFETIVCFDIDLVHLTEGGSFNDGWIDFSFLWHSKMNEANQLPMSSIPKSMYQVKDAELGIANNWLKVLMKLNISFHYRLKWLSALGMSATSKMLKQTASFLIYPFVKSFLPSAKKKNA